MVTNGKINTKQLTKVDGWAYLAPSAATAWAKFQKELKRTTGREPVITYPDGAYRTYDRQVYWWNIFQRNGRPVAARPGTSNHGLGMAVDISNYTRYTKAQLVAAGNKTGWYFDTPSEKWHMRYTGAPNYKSLTPAGGGTSPLGDDDDMAAILKNNDTAKVTYRYAVSDGKFTFDFILGDGAQQTTRVARKKRLYGYAEKGCTPGEFKAEFDDVNANRIEAGMPPIKNPNG